jgi:gliding motility-associated protein GldM
MAGGKETPRQKMIGMMYLVLLALLALQVSNTVLEKFIFINKSLESTVQETNVSNANTVGRIQAQVDEAGNRKDDVAVLAKAQAVREQTKQVLENMNNLKEELVQMTGGLGDDGQTPKNVADEETMANYMINQKRGEELQKMLNEYAAFLQQTTGRETAPIALDAKENPVFANDPNQNNKNFSELNFANTPLVAGIATISQYETEVLMRESAALEKLARDVGAQDMKFDRIIPMVRPESKIVAAGTKYKADMFIAASSSGVTPDMYVDGKKVPVSAEGMGQVEFMASGGTYNEEGLARKTFESKITVSLPGGADTTYSNTIEYFVAKPVMQIQSAAVQALYLQCGNELNVQVPALGSNYNPNFSASGAAVYEGNKPGIVTIVPNAANVTLSVTNNGTPIGSEKFGVRRVPKPELVPYSGNKPIDMKTGVPATSIRSLTMRAIADESFAQFLPKDAQFRVSEYTVYLARGNRPVDQAKASGPDVDLRRFAAKAKAGDRIVIEVSKVQRMNFRKEVIDVPMGTPIFNVQLN